MRLADGTRPDWVRRASPDLARRVGHDKEQDMRTRVVVGLVVFSLVVALPALAQSPTGTISGRVTDQSGGVMPGVTVTATSVVLQGSRTTVTAENGDYLIPLLPPGDYTVMFEISGFQTVRRTVGLAGTQTVTLNETMTVSQLAEEVTVIGGAETFTQTVQVGAKLKQDLIATLPTNRSLDAALLLFPAVHPTGPSGSYSISGAVSYEGLYTVNGVAVTENLRGQPIHLYIEDALQETTITASGVSAEYGRFGGGLIGAVTKSGGNQFSGSYRQSFNNDNWRTTTPFANDVKTNKVIPTYEYTLGGPVMTDRLWFFNAGRFQTQKASFTTAAPTSLPYVRTTDEKRYEGKLTFSPASGHRVAGSYLRADQLFENVTQFNVLDLASLGTQEQHSNLTSIHYTGVLDANLFAEIQYANRTASLIGAGSRSRDLIFGTLVTDQQRNLRYWSPTFCGGCGADHRDNNEVVFKGSYFLSTNRRGSHNIVAGYDRYHDHRQANNYQSGSGYRILGTASVVRGTEVFPVFQSGLTAILYTPILQESQGTDLVTHSLFLNDEWRYNGRVTFNLGVRWDHNNGEDAAGRPVSNSSKVSPRLGIVVDPKGDGQWTATASVARYVSALNTVIAEVSPAGNPAAYQWIYLGPSINPDPTQPTLVGTEAAIGQVFDWLNANGGTNRPPNLSSLPGVNTQINGALDSPNANEFAFGVSRQLFARGTLRADFVYRKYDDFYGQRTDLSTGRVTNAAGQVFDLTLVENTNLVNRQYKAFMLQGTQRLGSRVDLGGHYTLSRASGNFDGETSAAGPVSSRLPSYPEYIQAAWFSPEGDLSIDQRHRVRVWGTYNVPMASAAGSLNVSLLHQYGSGVPYGAVGGVTTVPFVTNPGYVAPSGNRPGGLWDYYFAPRDAFRTEGSNRTDLAVNYGYRIPAARHSVELFVHAEVLNLFNVFQLCACGDTVFRNGGNSNLNKINQGVVSPGTGGMQLFNPMTTAPVRGVNWNYAANFGTAVDRFAYTTPRTFRFNLGVRF
jgi:outer membrane receptor protein involved in Fe transport